MFLAFFLHVCFIYLHSVALCVCVCLCVCFLIIYLFFWEEEGSRMKEGSEGKGRVLSYIIDP